MRKDDGETRGTDSSVKSYLNKNNYSHGKERLAAHWSIGTSSDLSVYDKLRAL